MKHIQEPTPRCMFIFFDDIVQLGDSGIRLGCCCIVLFGELREEINWRLETCRQALEAYGFCSSMERKSTRNVSLVKGKAPLA